MGPRGEAFERRQRLGQVGLQHNAGLILPQRGTVEQSLKDLDRQVEVAKLFHVEVEKGGGHAKRRGLVERRQSLDDAINRLVEGPHVQLAHHGRDLDRHVVDVGALHELGDAREPTNGFAVSQHGLAEQVDVEAVATALQSVERATQPARRRVNDEVPDHAPQYAARNRHDGPRGDAGERPSDRNQHAQGPGQEARDARRELLEIARRNAQVVGPRDPVDEADGKVEPHLVLQQPGQSLGTGVGPRTLRRAQPLPHEGDRSVGVGLGVRLRARRHAFSLARRAVCEK